MPRRLAAIGLATACAAGAAYLALGARDAAEVQHARDLGRHRDYAAAVRTARGIHRPPARARAELVEAYALVGLGDYAHASAAYARAAADDPNNWLIRRDWASALLHLHRPRAARAQLARALALNPRMPLPRDLYELARGS